MTPLGHVEPSSTAHTPAAVNAEPVTRQCAWCWLVMDPSGHYDIRPGRKIKSATHGICPGCKEAVRAEIDRPVHAQPVLLAAA